MNNSMTKTDGIMTTESTSTPFETLCQRSKPKYQLRHHSSPQPRKRSNRARAVRSSNQTAQNHVSLARLHRFQRPTQSRFYQSNFNLTEISWYCQKYQRREK